MEKCAIQWFSEFSGSVANFGIIFPIMVGVSFATGLHLGTMLLVCGVWYILIGVWYGIPLSVEPLKAISALAIGYELSSIDIVTSGIVVGIVMLLLGMTGGMQYISDLIPQVPGFLDFLLFLLFCVELLRDGGRFLIFPLYF